MKINSFIWIIVFIALTSSAFAGDLPCNGISANSHDQFTCWCNPGPVYNPPEAQGQITHQGECIDCMNPVTRKYYDNTCNFGGVGHSAGPNYYTRNEVCSICDSDSDGLIDGTCPYGQLTHTSCGYGIKGWARDSRLQSGAWDLSSPSNQLTVDIYYELKPSGPRTLLTTVTANQPAGAYGNHGFEITDLTTLAPMIEAGDEFRIIAEALPVSGSCKVILDTLDLDCSDTEDCNGLDDDGDGFIDDNNGDPTFHPTTGLPVSHCVCQQFGTKCSIQPPFVNSVSADFKTTLLGVPTSCDFCGTTACAGSGFNDPDGDGWDNADQTALFSCDAGTHTGTAYLNCSIDTSVSATGTPYYQQEICVSDCNIGCDCNDFDCQVGDTGLKCDGCHWLDVSSDSELCNGMDDDCDGSLGPNENTQSSGIEIGSLLCADGIDTDCDALTDWDTQDWTGGTPGADNGIHGDDGCAVDVIFVNLSNNEPIIGSTIDIHCQVSVSSINSAFIYLDNNSDGQYRPADDVLIPGGVWGTGSQSDIYMVTYQTTQLGINIIGCGIYDDPVEGINRSYQSGADQFASMDVILCPEGTRYCPDGTCRVSCDTGCNNDTVCDAGETCACSDCYYETSGVGCAAGLTCCPFGTCQPLDATCLPTCPQPSILPDQRCVGDDEYLYDELNQLCDISYGTKNCCICETGPDPTTMCTTTSVNLMDTCGNVCGSVTGTDPCNPANCPAVPPPDANQMCITYVQFIYDTDGNICDSVTGTLSCNPTCPTGPDPSEICVGTEVPVYNASQEICKYITGTDPCILSVCPATPIPPDVCYGDTVDVYDNNGDICNVVTGTRDCSTVCPQGSDPATICTGENESVFDGTGALCNVIIGTKDCAPSCPVGPDPSEICTGVSVPVYDTTGTICKSVTGTQSCTVCPAAPASGEICSGNSVYVYDSDGNVCDVVNGNAACVTCPSGPTPDSICIGEVAYVYDSNGLVCNTISGTNICNPVICPAGPDPSTICQGSTVHVYDSNGDVCDSVSGSASCSTCPVTPDPLTICVGITVYVTDANGNVCDAVSGSKDCIPTYPPIYPEYPPVYPPQDPPVTINCPIGPAPSEVCEGETVYIYDSTNTVCRIISGTQSPCGACPGSPDPSTICQGTIVPVYRGNTICNTVSGNLVCGASCGTIPAPQDPTTICVGNSATETNAGGDVCNVVFGTKSCGSGCPAGTLDCGDGTCQEDCGIERACDYDGICEEGESCLCFDCESKQDTCQAGCVCEAGLCACSSYCGDSVQDAGEECDDGNTNVNDDCTNGCKLATCGDGYIWFGHEDCDDGLLNGQEGFCADDCYYPPQPDSLNKQLVQTAYYYSEVMAVSYLSSVKYHLTDNQLKNRTNKIFNPLYASDMNKYGKYLSPDNCLESMHPGESCIQIWYVNTSEIGDFELYDYKSDLIAGTAKPDTPVNPLPLFVQYDATGTPSPSITPFLMIRVIPTDVQQGPQGQGVIRGPTRSDGLWAYVPSLPLPLPAANIMAYEGKWSCKPGYVRDGVKEQCMPKDRLR